MLEVLNGPTISQGESLSDGVDCRAGQLVRITMPTDWDAAALTFQFSTDGVFYNDMYGIDGYAAQIKTVVPGAGVIIPGDVGRAVGFLKLRSGTPGNPVVQRGDRVFAITIVTDEPFDPEAPPVLRRGG